MEESLPEEKKEFENTAVTGIFGAATPSQDSDGENVVSLESQTHGLGRVLDEEVVTLLQSAASQAGKTPDDPPETEPEVKLDELLQKDDQISTPVAGGSSTAFTAISAFVAGLAVVGVVYAFAVQGTLDQYKSVVLGDSIESSK